MIRFIIFAFALSVTSPAFGQNVQRYDSSKNWSMFADQDVCWVASAAKYANGNNILMMVTTFRGKGAPQVSFRGQPRLSKSAGLSLNIDKERYALKSDGKTAWPRKQADNAAIKHLFASDLSGEAGIELQLRKRLTLHFSASGFRKAFTSIMKKCNRPLDPALR
jgi:hypothetical protein